MFSRLTSLLLLLSLAVAVSAKAPKYVFYFIGDGMGMGHVLSTETYNRTVLGNDEHITMLQFPISSMVLTYSANNKITDSAAAGTALSTGTKTRNGMLGMNPDTVNVYSIAKSFKESGYGVAIATSVPIDDATPAAFYTHVPNRKMFYEIGLDLAKSGYDMFAGSKLRGLKDKNGKENDLMSTIKKNGYTVVTGAAEYEKNKNSKKILLLNGDPTIEHNGYTIDSVATNLKLPFITQACLDHMKMVSPDKFFMMIEGGNIDWAAHANDGGAVIKEVLNFNEAIAIAYNFYKEHPDETLIVITADHNTGGMALGVGGGSYNPDLGIFDYQKISIEMFQSKCKEWKESGKTITWDFMKNFLKENLGLYGPVAVSKANDELIQKNFEKTFIKNESKDTKTLYTTYNEFVATVFDIQNRTASIGWTTKSHTGDFVPVFAVGCGAEQFSGLNNNIQLPAKIRQIVGLK